MSVIKKLTKIFIYSWFCSTAIIYSMWGIASGTHHGGHDDHHEEEVDKGVHGGRLLTDGDIAVELLIFEQGMEPRFYAWVTDKGANINQGNIHLKVELGRLGGQNDQFEFTSVNIKDGESRLEGDGIVGEPHSFDVKVQLEYKSKKYSWDYPSYEGRVSIDESIAVQAGIKTVAASSGTVHRTVIAYGKLSADPSGLSHIHARFPGLITKVMANIGDKVRAGDALAEIESNASLKRYVVKSPLAGVVIERHANAGESSKEQLLFTVANYQQLWAELQIFPGNMEVISEQQPVILKSGQRRYESVIKYLVPNDADQPYVKAMVPIDNSNLQWTPGLLVEGEVLVEKNPVALVVDNRALQNWRDWVVAFIKVENDYEVRPLVLGRRDGRFSEVLDGLQAGDNYVVENSYLIKADIEKSGASHDH